MSNNPGYAKGDRNAVSKHVPQETARERKERKQETAIERQTASEMRSNADQLALLEERGHGHCAEAQCLRKLINLDGK